MSEKKIHVFVRESISRWYEKNSRDFPWRKTTNLFEILVTEILLQKTIATNVNNLYETFFRKYNGFSAIFNVNSEELEKDIKSLGLSKKRSKILKDLSKLVMEDYQGKIPIRADDLKEVKGIADYVSKAFSCIGLGVRTLFFDVNIKRVVERVFNNFDPSKKIKDQIEERLDDLLPDSNCKHFYWALLDFASAVCTKINPKCESCVISMHCHYLTEESSKKKKNYFKFNIDS